MAAGTNDRPRHARGERERDERHQRTGEIVGWAETRALVRDSSGYFNRVYHGFLWRKGQMRDLGSLYGMSEAKDINVRGQVVGSLDTGKKDPGSKYEDEPIWHAFLWQEGRMRDLTPRRVNSTSEAINGRSKIVGAWWKLGNSGSDPWDEAVLWQHGKMVFLGGSARGVSHATSINERGQVVGWSETRNWDDHAVLWRLKRG